MDIAATGKDLIGLGNILSGIVSKDTNSKQSSSVVSNSKKEEEEVDPNLNNPERSRLKEIVKIFGEELKIGKYDKPEAARLRDLTPTQAQQIKATPPAIKDKVQSPTPKKSFLDDLIAGLLGLLGLGSIGAAIIKIKNWLLKQLSRFVIAPIAKLFTWVGKKLWWAVKSIGRKLVGFVKWVSQKIWSGMKLVGTKIWKGIKLLGSKILSWGSKLVDKIKNSKFYTGFMSKLQSAKEGLKGIWDDVINGVKGYIDDIARYVTQIKDAILSALKKVPGYNVAKKGIEMVGRGVAATGGAVGRVATATGGAIGRAATATGGAIGRVVVATGGALVPGLGATISAGKREISSFIGSIFKQGSSKIGTFLKGLPYISGIIETLFTAYDIKNLKKDYKEGKITLDELRLKAGTRVAKGVTGVGGAALGTIAGAVIGGPIGAFVGGIGGDILGRYLGDLLVKNVISPDITKKLGAFVTRTGEMQDFMVKGNNVYKFNTKDEFIGLKSGGAIDNVFKDLTEGISKDNSTIKDASIAQVNRLDQLIELMGSFLQKSGSQGGGNINISNGNNYTPSTTFNLREQFNAQTLLT